LVVQLLVVVLDQSYQDLLETWSGLWCRTYQRYEWLTMNASIYNLISAFEMWSFHIMWKRG